jgi:hypothetical protein
MIHLSVAEITDRDAKAAHEPPIGARSGLTLWLTPLTPMD